MLVRQNKYGLISGMSNELLRCSTISMSIGPSAPRVNDIDGPSV
jgi:hypothetical protein